jgi:hemoglobin
MTDINSELDIDILVRKFYDKLLNDKLMSPYFQDLDLESHFKNIVAFWSLILLDKPGYQNNVFEKHARLEINETHFERWVLLFCETIDDLYNGQKADLAKSRAHILSYTFISKMNKKSD